MGLQRLQAGACSTCAAAGLMPRVHAPGVRDHGPTARGCGRRRVAARLLSLAAPMAPVIALTPYPGALSNSFHPVPAHAQQPPTLTAHMSLWVSRTPGVLHARRLLRRPGLPHHRTRGALGQAAAQGASGGRRRRRRGRGRRAGAQRRRASPRAAGACVRAFCGAGGRFRERRRGWVIIAIVLQAGA